jgi:HSP20 family molecular chaperone IbpA
MKNLTNFFYKDNNLFNAYFKEINENYYNKTFDYTINELSNSNFLLEVALPGFDKNNIEVEKTKNQLTIRKKSEKGKNNKYLLLKTFNLEKNIEVGTATIKNGLLTIKLTEVIPETEKPKLITIN